MQFRAFLDSGGGGLSDAEQAAVDLIFPSKTVGDTDWRGTHNDEWTDFIGAMADDIGQKTGVGFYSKIVDTFDKWLKDNKVFNIGIWQAIQGPVLSKKEISAVIKQFIRSKGELRIVTGRIIPQIKSILKKKGKSQNEINKILDAVTDQADKMKKVLNDLIEDHIFLSKAIHTPYKQGSKEKLNDYVQSRKRQIEAFGENIIRLGTKLIEHKNKLNQLLGALKKDAPKLIEKEYTPEEQQTFWEEVGDIVTFYGSGKAIYSDPHDPTGYIILAIEMITLIVAWPALAAAGGAVLALKMILGEMVVLALIMKWDKIIENLWVPDVFEQVKRATELGINSDLTPDWLIKLGF